MKTATAVVLLLFAFTSKSYLFGVANAANSPVLDTDGDDLQVGVQYYVVSSIWGAGGGGLDLGRAIGQSCPEIVVQRQSDLVLGTPVIFSNADSKDGVVRVSTDINIEFVPIRDRLCSTSTVWKLDNYDNSAGKWWVTTDGGEGGCGRSRLTSRFKIEKVGRIGYKLRLCPSVCESCITLSSDIGKSGDSGQTHMAVCYDGYPWAYM
uniref:Putative 21 kDa trypsin inhibitor n=1 Tax=Theobroma grandiflorum TaxID=108881 RepID=Q3BD86_9ROSI|nr:putative 21 kDa trypsin inhibitor [Theobroma grandiflorum]